MPISKKRKFNINKKNKTQKGGSFRSSNPISTKSIYNAPPVPSFDPGIKLPDVPMFDPKLYELDDNCFNAQKSMTDFMNHMRQTKTDMYNNLKIFKENKKNLPEFEKQKKLICAKYNFYLKTLYRTSTNTAEILIETLAPPVSTKKLSVLHY